MPDPYEHLTRGSQLYILEEAHGHGFGLDSYVQVISGPHDRDWAIDEWGFDEDELCPGSDSTCWECRDDSGEVYVVFACEISPQDCILDKLVKEKKKGFAKWVEALENGSKE